MRNKHFQISVPVIIFFLFMWFIPNSQGQDTQWYVQDGIGWDGRTWRSPDPVHRISTNLLLENIKEPDRLCCSDARHDLFIIFTDGTCYNSRYLATVPEYRYTPITARFSNLLIDSPKNKILYLYSTNVYDTEPPPTNVRAKSSTNTNNAITPITPSQILSANHSVAYDKDITLIAKLAPAIKSFTLLIDTLYSVRNGVDTTYYLVNNGFSLAPVFTIGGNPRAVYPVPELIRLANNRMFINNPHAATEGLIYINLNASDLPLLDELITDYDPDIDTLYAQFKLFQGDNLDQPFAELHEPILEAFDPNYLHAVKTCKENNEAYICYNGQFYNQTRIPATNLAFEFVIPEHVVPGEISFTHFTVNGEVLDTSELALEWTDERKLLIKLPAELDIKLCTDDTTSGYVKFSFCLRVKDDFVDLISTMDLTLTDPKTYFFYGKPNQQEYPMEFEDRTYMYDIKGEQSNNNSTSNVKSIGERYRVVSNDCSGFGKDNPDGKSNSLIILYVIVGVLIIGLLLILFFRRNGE